MAGIKIPIYEQTQTPQGAVMPVNARANTATSQALQNVGQAMTGVAKLYDDKLNNDAQVEAQRQLATHESEVLQSLHNQANTLGTTDPTGFAGKFNDSLKKIREESVSSVTSADGTNPYLQKHLNTGWDKLQQEGFVRALGVEEKALSVWNGKQLDDLGNAQLKTVRLDPSQFGAKVEQYGATVDSMQGIPAAQKTEAKTKFASAAASQVFDTVIEQDPKAALAALKNEKDPRTAALSADDHSRALDKAQNEIDKMKSRAEADAAKREAGAARVLSQYENLFLLPGGPSADATDQARKAVRGTPYEADFNAMQADGKEIQRVMRLPATEQAAYIQNAYSELQKSGNDLSNPKARFVARLNTAFDAQNKAFDADPISANARFTGVAVTPLTGNLDVDAAELHNRANVLAGLSSQRGVQFDKPLTESEAAQWGTALKAAPPVDRAKILGQFRNAIGDDRMFRGAVTQMLNDDPLGAAAGIASGMNLKTTAGRDVGVMILDGQKILSDKTVQMPKTKGSGGDSITEQFNENIGDAIPPGSPAREVALNATRAVYAKLAIEPGGPGLTTEMDKRLFQQALNIATGGIHDYNGAPVIAPYGMADGEFQTRARTATLTTAKAHGVDGNALLDLPLIPAGDGVYMLRDGNRPAVGKDGKPIVIDINKISLTKPTIGNAAVVASSMFSGGL